MGCTTVGARLGSVRLWRYSEGCRGWKTRMLLFLRISMKMCDVDVKLPTSLVGICQDASTQVVTQLPEGRESYACSRNFSKITL